MDMHLENKAFFKRMQRAPLSVYAQLLWHKLMQIDNDLFWAEQFSVDNERLRRLICAKSMHTLISARKELMDDGLIIFKAGVKGKPSAYQLISVVALEGGGNRPVSARPSCTDFLYEVREDITTYFGYTEALGQELRSVADALWEEFYPGQRPSPGDIREVFHYIMDQKREDDGSYTMTFPEERKQMLAYAFDQARLNGALNWGYIQGIYRNWAERRTNTMQDIYDHEYNRDLRRGQM